MRKDRVKVTAEMWALRVRNLFYTAVQVTGFALVAFGVYTFFRPLLTLYGYSNLLPSGIAEALPQLSMFEGVGVMFAGFVVVWLSTSSWF